MHAHLDAVGAHAGLSICAFETCGLGRGRWAAVAALGHVRVRAFVHAYVRANHPRRLFSSSPFSFLWHVGWGSSSSMGKRLFGRHE